MKDIDTLYFEDVEDFTFFAVCNLESLNALECEDISVIVSASEVANYVTNFIQYGMNIEMVEVSAPEYDGYEDAYIISLFDGGVWCEKLKRDDEYIGVDSKIVFVSNECNSACLKNIKSDEVYAFGIGEDEEFECDEDCESCDMSEFESSSISDYIHRDDFGNLEGFTKNWYEKSEDGSYHASYSYFDSNVNKLKEVAEMFDIRL